MHDIGVCGTNLDDGRDLTSPEGETVGVKGGQLIADGSHMIDESEVLDVEVLRVRRRVDVEVGEGELSSLLPHRDGRLNLGSPHEIGLVRGRGTIFGDGHVIVGAADLVLGAVTALGEALVTSDVATLASITALAGLGVTAAGGATTRTGHYGQDGGGLFFERKR